MKTPFIFGDGTPLQESAVFCAEMPSGFHSKLQLFSELQTLLRFPEYFGSNWDALEECIRDLAWLPLPGLVVLIHRDLPLESDLANLKIYLSILTGAVEKKQVVAGEGALGLAVVFPLDARQRVEQVLRDADGVSA